MTVPTTPQQDVAALLTAEAASDYDTLTDLVQAMPRHRLEEVAYCLTGATHAMAWQWAHACGTDPDQLWRRTLQHFGLENA